MKRSVASFVGCKVVHLASHDFFKHTLCRSFLKIIKQITIVNNSKIHGMTRPYEYWYYFRFSILVLHPMKKYEMKPLEGRGRALLPKFWKPIALFLPGYHSNVILVQK